MWISYLYLFSVVAAFSLTVFAAWSDLRSFTIPNWISIALCALFPIAVLTSPIEIDWLWAITLSGGVLIVGFLLFALGGLGGGDVKLISALCLWAGLGSIIPFLFATVLAGGVLVPIILFREVLSMPEDAGSLNRKIRKALRARLKIPYGVAISLGSLLIFFDYANNANIFG